MQERQPAERAGARLTRAEERELAERLRDGDPVAEDRLVSCHLPFVLAIARRYSRYGAPLNDLVQEGLIGFIEAARHFNPNAGVRLATYARWSVRAAIQDYVISSWSVVRIGTTAAQKALFFRLRRLAGDLAEGLGMDPESTLDDRLRRLAGRFRLAPDELQALARRIGGRDRSLNEPAGPRATADWLDRLHDWRPTPEQHAAAASERRFWRDLVGQALAGLPQREQLIIRRRYFAEAKVSFEMIAGELGLSKERVRQLERQALAELRRLLEAGLSGAPPSIQGESG